MSTIYFRKKQYCITTIQNIFVISKKQSQKHIKRSLYCRLKTCKKTVHKRQKRALLHKRKKNAHQMTPDEQKELRKYIAQKTRDDYLSNVDNNIADIDNQEMYGNSKEISHQVKIISGKCNKCSPIHQKIFTVTRLSPTKSCQLLEQISH